MVSVTISLDDELKAKVERFLWVNWSEVGREEALKKEIFERFIKTGTLSDVDQEFCDKVGWYPIDELELKEEYIKKLREIERGPHRKMSLLELDKLLGLK